MTSENNSYPRSGGRFKRLPKWAQQELEVLWRNYQKLESTLTRALGAEGWEEGRVRLHYVSGVNKFHSLPDRTHVRFLTDPGKEGAVEPDDRWADNFLEVSLSPDHHEITVRGARPLDVRPEAGNTVRIRLGEWI